MGGGGGDSGAQCVLVGVVGRKCTRCVSIEERRTSSGEGGRGAEVVVVELEEVEQEKDT